MRRQFPFSRYDVKSNALIKPIAERENTCIVNELEVYITVILKHKITFSPPKTARLHHSGYRPCSASEGFVCLWLLGNSQQFTSQQATPRRRSVPRNTLPTSAKTLEKVTPVNPGGINSFRSSPGDRLRSLGYEDPPSIRCCPVDIERSGFALL